MGKPPAEVGKSNGPVQRKLRRPQRQTTSEPQEPRDAPEDARCVRGQQNQKQNAAPRTQGQTAPAEPAPTIEYVREQLHEIRMLGVLGCGLP